MRGVWGRLAAGIFNEAGFSLSVIGVRLLGIVVAFIWAFGLGLIALKLISATIGLRVTPKKEMAGLDLSEHRAQAYPGFSVTHPGVPASSATPIGCLGPVNPQIEQRS